MKVFNLDNKEVGDISLNPDIYQQEMRIDIIHRVVEWQRAKSRSGTHKTKGISDISGTTRKPFKQKGTGNARQGSLRSPQFRGGAVIFGPVVRDHGYSMPKKVKNMALKIALSSKLSEKKLLILDNLSLKTHKTKDLTEKLSKIGLDSALFVGVDKKRDVSFCRAYSNVKHIDALPSCAVNVYDILRHGHLVLTTEAIEAINTRLS